MTRSFALFLVIVCGCGPQVLRERTDGGAAPRTDAGSPERDAGAVLPRPDPRDLPPDPALDALDRSRDPACPTASEWIVAVRGRVLDARNAPIDGAIVQPCVVLDGGRRVCLRPGIAGPDGVATAIFPEGNRCVEEVAIQILAPGSSRAIGYCAVADAPEGGVIVPSRPLVLPDTGAPRDRPPVGDASAPRELAFDGLTMSLSPDALFVGLYEELRASVVPAQLSTETCLGDGTPMDLLVAFSPEAAVRPAEGLPAEIAAPALAGERVELLVLGGNTAMLPTGVPLVEARWLPFATVTVGADGTLATPAGTGLPHLGWLGARRAP